MNKEDRDDIVFMAGVVFAFLVLPIAGIMIGAAIAHLIERLP